MISSESMNEKNDYQYCRPVNKLSFWRRTWQWPSFKSICLKEGWVRQRGREGRGREQGGGVRNSRIVGFACLARNRSLFADSRWEWKLLYFLWHRRRLSMYIWRSAMLLGLILFKAHHISWKKKQKQEFFQPKKDNSIKIFSKFVNILDIIFKNCWGGKNIFKILPFYEFLED